MSELVNARTNGTDFRRQLLMTASAIALIGFAYGAKAADDDSSDRPTLWIELGGQLSRLNDGQEAFAPAFAGSPSPPSSFLPSVPFEKLPAYGFDETGKVSFEPSGSDWVLSASVHYGRSSSTKHVDQQTHPQPNIVQFTIIHASGYTQPVHVSQFARAAQFAKTDVENGESHAVLDFQAGKDVGLGMFGSKSGSSVFNLGVRFAQFNSRTNIALKSDPDFHRLFKYFTYPAWQVYGVKELQGSGYHSNAASLQATRSFHGIGPSLSWNASAPLIGNAQSNELSFDWGLNAAVLFGRQRAVVHHHMTAQYHPITSLYRHCYGCRETISQPPPANLTRSRTITVPNVGGFAGATWRIQNVKVSAGYRADLFFGAMDGGIDTRKKENVGFYGPFASVSIGIGG